MNGISLSVVRELTAADTDAVGRLAAEATEADGVAPLSEPVRLRLKHGGEAGSWNVLARRLTPEGSRVIGYAFLDKSDPVKPSAELFVGPAYRREGVGGALLDALGMKVSARRGDGPLHIWAHGGLPAAAALAASRGMEAFRELWIMARPLGGADAVPRPAGVLPGVDVRAFRPGTDDDAWVALNAKAFAHHPEQGSMTVADLRERQAEPWFDPAGFFLAWRGDRLIGFHWTKVHPAGPGRPEPVGEVYVLGVDPGEQGGGLGKALMLIGLSYLEDRGLSEVILYVEADNAPAVKVYTKLGFVKRGADVMYQPQVEPTSSA